MFYPLGALKCTWQWRKHEQANMLFKTMFPATFSVTPERDLIVNKTVLLCLKTKLTCLLRKWCHKCQLPRIPMEAVPTLHRI